MEYNNLSEEILKTEKLERLYEIQLELNQDIATLHDGIRNAQTTSEQGELKGDLSIAYNMLEICKHRIDDLKVIQKADRDTNAKLNHHFKVAAKGLLKKETYQQLMELANKSVREIRDSRKTPANKVE